MLSSIARSADDGLQTEDHAGVLLGTRFEGALLEVASEALDRAQAAQLRGDIGAQTRNSVAVILAAEAAVEAFLNAEGREDPG
jgi:hypothetical protein